jgi:hypothetical protein
MHGVTMIANATTARPRRRRGAAVAFGTSARRRGECGDPVLSSAVREAL